MAPPASELWEDEDIIKIGLEVDESRKENVDSAKSQLWREFRKNLVELLASNPLGLSEQALKREWAQSYGEIIDYIVAQLSYSEMNLKDFLTTDKLKDLVDVHVDSQTGSMVFTAKAHQDNAHLTSVTQANNENVLGKERQEMANSRSQAEMQQNRQKLIKGKGIMLELISQLNQSLPYASFDQIKNAFHYCYSKPLDEKVLRRYFKTESMLSVFQNLMKDEVHVKIVDGEPCVKAQMTLTEAKMMWDQKEAMLREREENLEQKQPYAQEPQRRPVATTTKRRPPVLVPLLPPIQCTPQPTQSQQTTSERPRESSRSISSKSTYDESPEHLSTSEQQPQKIVDNHKANQNELEEINSDPNSDISWQTSEPAGWAEKFGHQWFDDDTDEKRPKQKTKWTAAGDGEYTDDENEQNKSAFPTSSSLQASNGIETNKPNSVPKQPNFVHSQMRSREFLPRNSQSTNSSDQEPLEIDYPYDPPGNTNSLSKIEQIYAAKQVEAEKRREADRKRLAEEEARKRDEEEEQRRHEEKARLKKEKARKEREDQIRKQKEEKEKRKMEEEKREREEEKRRVEEWRQKQAEVERWELERVQKEMEERRMAEEAELRRLQKEEQRRVEQEEARKREDEARRREAERQVQEKRIRMLQQRQQYQQNQGPETPGLPIGSVPLREPTQVTRSHLSTHVPPNPPTSQLYMNPPGSQAYAHGPPAVADMRPHQASIRPAPHPQFRTNQEYEYPPRPNYVPGPSRMGHGHSTYGPDPMGCPLTQMGNYQQRERWDQFYSSRPVSGAVGYSDRLQAYDGHLNGYVESRPESRMTISRTTFRPNDYPSRLMMQPQQPVQSMNEDADHFPTAILNNHPYELNNYWQRLAMAISSVLLVKSPGFVILSKIMDIVRPIFTQQEYIEPIDWLQFLRDHCPDLEVVCQNTKIHIKYKTGM